MYKIMPGLLNNSGIIELNIIVFEETGVILNLHKVISEIEVLGGIITHNGSDNYVIRTQINATKIYDIALIPEVEWIDMWSAPGTYMNNIRKVTGASTLHYNIPQFQGQDIRGVVKDIGLEAAHPDYTIEDVLGLLIPDNDHGTATFGTLFSTGSENNNAMGMLPQGTGYFQEWSINRYYTALKLSTDWNGLFQSNSWGSTIQDGIYSSVSNENDRSVFDFDITMLYAVGNSNYEVNPETIDRDSAAKNIISVGAIQHADDDIWNDADRWINRGIRNTPSQGPAADGRVKPDLVGPNDFGFVTDSVDGDGENGYRIGNYVTKDNNDYLFRGTSFATPVVAGAAGLVYQMYRENHFGNNPSGDYPHASTVKALLIANSHQIDAINPGLDPNWGDGRYQQGWGFVDVGKVFEVGDDHYIINEDIPRQGITPPLVNFDIHNIYVQNNRDLKITLTWTDPPATPEADPALVNNLNLEVIDPNGVHYWGNNGLLNSIWSTSGTGPNEWYEPQVAGDPILYFDNLNNVENIFIQNPTEGKWQIRVYGHNIIEDAYTPTPEDDQTYALVVSYHPAKVVPLYQDWNLISLPLIQTNPHYTEVLRSIDGYYDNLDIYDNEEKEWDWYNYPNLDHLMGFWIHIINTNEIELIVYGNDITVDQNIELYWKAASPVPEGWNLVGYPSQGPNERDYAIQPWSVPDPIGVIQWYDASISQWYNLQQGQDFELGRGYWMYYYGDPANPSITWTVPHEEAP
jgi:hypothetical protein